MEQKVVTEEILSAMPTPPPAVPPRQAPGTRHQALSIQELEKRLAPSGGGQVGWGC